jgi:hypothetical protein
MAHYDIKFSPGFAQAGSTQEGNSIISKPGPVDYTEGGWYGGFNDGGSYLVVSDTDSTSLYGRSTANGTGGTADVNMPTFWKVPKNDTSILNLINRLPGSPGNFTSAADAKNWVQNTPGYGLVTGQGGGLGMLLLANIDGNLNYFTITQDYITGPVDLGINTYNYNYYAINGSYLIFDYNNSIGIFIDSDGVILDSREYSNSTDYGTADDKWLYVNDYNNKVFVYSDGNRVDVVDWSSTDNYYPDWNYDAATLSGGLIMHTSQGNDHAYFMVNHSTSQFGGLGTLIYEWDNSLYQVYEYVYNQGDFIFITKQDRNNSYSITEFSVISNAGEVLHTLDLSGESVNDWNINFYGHNKGNVFLYSYNNINQRYVLINYDGSIDSFIHTTHARGSNYGNWDYFYTNEYVNYAQRSPSENFILFLYDNGYSWDGSGYQISYGDFIAYFDGVTSVPTPLVFQDSGTQDKKWDYDSLLSQDFCMWVMTDIGGANQWKLLSITPSGLSYNTSIDHGTSNWTYWTGDNRILWWNNDTTTFTIFDTAGNVLDTLSCPEGYSDIIYNGKSFVIITSVKSKYINGARTTFDNLISTQTPYGYSHAHANTCEDYPANNTLQKGNILLINQNDWTAQIISDTSIHKITLGYDPTISGSWGYSVSKTTFCIYNIDPTPQFVARIYGLDGTLLNSINITAQSYVNVVFDINLVDDTFFFGLQLDSTYKYGYLDASTANVLDYNVEYANYTLSNYNYWDC